MVAFSERLPRIVLGLWLALFFLLGFQTLFRNDYPAGTWPWMGYLVYSLIFGIPVVLIVLKPLYDLGAVWWTVCAGFLVLFSYYLFDLIHGLNYGHSWFWMYVRLHTGIFGDPEGFNWIEAAQGWAQGLHWFRIVTYAGLGYVVARRNGLFIATVVSMLAGIVDNVFGWLVYLPDGGDFEAPSLSVVLQYEPGAVTRAIFIQSSILAIFGALGALISRMHESLYRQRPARHFSRVRRVALQDKLGQ